MRQRTVTIQTAPHLHSGANVAAIMRQVLWALLPVAAFAVYLFGFAALATLLTSTAACMLSEHLLCRLNSKSSTLYDGSAAITGLLLGLTLPPHLPLWMTALGGFVAIALGKFLFGGLGSNLFNPSLVGRAVLQAAFPSEMTTWLPAMTWDRFSALPPSLLTFPFATPSYAAVTGASPTIDSVVSATPLALMKFEQQLTPTSDLLLGLTSGSTGETCALLIVLGGGYLALRKIIDWRIPVAILGSAAAWSAVLHGIDPHLYPPVTFMLFSGGLMLGAVFMATDPVAAPITHRGRLLYGALIGTLVVVIRLWGGLAEGVMYAILLANAITPLINRWLQPRVYGT